MFEIIRSMIIKEDVMEKKHKKIICYKCKKDTGLTEEVILKGNIKEDIKCPHCGAVVVTANIDYC
jgi:DNA-directed RNA polymerase subunit RPC12/RpoP